MGQNSNKRKGTARELHYLQKWRDQGFWGMRAYQSAGSGISKQEFITQFPEIWQRTKRIIKPIDIITMKEDVIFFHQISKHKKSISEDEITVLKYEAHKAGAISLISWLDKGKWCSEVVTIC